MRYSLYINQPVAIELGLENTTEAIIFDYLIIAPTWAEPIIIDNKVYYWVARQKICDEHPLLDLKTDTVYRYLKRLGKKGLITYIKQGKKDCIAITKDGKKYVSKAISENNPNPMSEKNPNKLGELSELTRKKIRHINIPSYPPTNDSLSAIKRADFLKSKNSFINYMRGNFMNKTIGTAIDQYTQNRIEISVTEKGYLYNKTNGESFQGTRAMEIWESLYRFALQDKLPILNQNTEETA